MWWNQRRRRRNQEDDQKPKLREKILGKIKHLAKKRSKAKIQVAKQDKSNKEKIETASKKNYWTKVPTPKRQGKI
ncbi:hypothetical protein HYD75_03985 [Mycoplasmopsis bovis]|nr:hypothetical protein [Mycoplasmopsis bovis]QQH49034.1 hypothetical protein HYD75_03985 [Mycoplasmopsis bovis]